MSNIGSIQLKTSMILNVPIQVYENDFTFEINGESFKTSRLVSDLISPKVSRLHSMDPTADKITVNTKHCGDFSLILQLINFKSVDYPRSESEFIFEVLEALEMTTEGVLFDQNDDEVTMENAFQLDIDIDCPNIIKSVRCAKRINFISAHFDELCEAKYDELCKLNVNTLYKILTNDNLRLKNEDQLLKFINKLYMRNFNYSILYESVQFQYVTKTVINEFLTIFDINDLSNMTWQRLSERLSQDIKLSSSINKERYSNFTADQIFLYKNGNKLNGIFQYFQKNRNIDDEINITASSTYGNGFNNNNYYRQQNQNYSPRNVILFNDRNKFFYSDNQPNGWLRFEFKNYHVNPTHYAIRAWNNAVDCLPESWVIEGSNDNEEWEVIDEINNNNYFNQPNNCVHTFKIENDQQKAFKWIQFRATNSNNMNTNFLIIDSFELYGTLIK